MLLTHLWVPYDEKRYEAKLVGHKYDLSEWMNEKLDLGIPFANLPYYVDSEIKLTESQAIMVFVCRKFKPEYLGRSRLESGKCAQLGMVLRHYRNDYHSLVYSPGYTQRKDEFIEKAITMFSEISEFIGEKPYTCSRNGPTWVDFVLFEELEVLDAMQPGTAENISRTFIDFRLNMRKLAHIENFIRNQADLPYNNIMASFKQIQQMGKCVSKQSKPQSPQDQANQDQNLTPQTDQIIVKQKKKHIDAREKFVIRTSES